MEEDQKQICRAISPSSQGDRGCGEAQAQDSQDTSAGLDGHGALVSKSCMLKSHSYQRWRVSGTRVWLQYASPITTIKLGSVHVGSVITRFFTSYAWVVWSWALSILSVSTSHSNLTLNCLTSPQIAFFSHPPTGWWLLHRVNNSALISCDLQAHGGQIQLLERCSAHKRLMTNACEGFQVSVGMWLQHAKVMMQRWCPGQSQACWLKPTASCEPWRMWAWIMWDPRNHSGI